MQWPKTGTGRALSIALIVVVVPFTVWLLMTGPSFVRYLFSAFGVIALVAVGVYLLRRKLDADRERDWVGEFSFGDVVGRMKARDALDRPGEPGTVVGAAASSGG